MTERERVPLIDEIFQNPTNLYVPKDDEILAVLTMNLGEGMTEENMGPVVTYILRPEFPRVCASIVIIMACKRNHHLCNEEGFIRWAKTLKESPL